MTDHVPEPRLGDVAEIAADDALLDALAHGERPNDDTLIAAFADLRGALDTAYADTAFLADLPGGTEGRHRLAHRTGFVAAAAVAAALSLTGVAAAVGGNANPLHRVVNEIVGDTSAPDRYAERADRLLDQAAAIVVSAQSRGFVTSDERARVTALLTSATDDVRRARPAAQARETERIAELRTTLATLTVRGDDGTTGASPEPGEDRGSASPEPGEDRRSATPEPGEDRSGSTSGDSQPSGGDTRSGSDDGSQAATPAPTPRESSDSSGGSDDGSDH